MQCSLSRLEEALVEEWITFEQFLQVLVDNFGMRETKKILKHNLRRAEKKERKSK